MLCCQAKYPKLNKEKLFNMYTTSALHSAKDYRVLLPPIFSMCCAQFEFEFAHCVGM